VFLVNTRARKVKVTVCQGYGITTFVNNFVENF